MYVQYILQNNLLQLLTIFFLIRLVIFKIMNKHILLSYPINNNTPTYGNSNRFCSKPVNRIDEGDSCNSLAWHLPNHLGTHLDAPRHFYNNGIALDAFDPSFWVFNNIVVILVHLAKGNYIIKTKDVLPYILGKPEMLLIKTGICYHRDKNLYWQNNPGLEPEIGHTLRERFPSLRAIGIDSISISPWQNREIGREAHRAFLNPAKGNPLVIIEDMDLTKVSSDSQISRIIVLPLLVENADGGPCTIIAELIE